MMDHFSGGTANEAWQKAADAFRSDKAELDLESRGEETKELLHVTFSIDNPRERWITSRYPPMSPALGISEIVWILAGRNDSAFPNFWNPQLPSFAGKGPTYHGAYGHRLRHNLGLDQLSRAYHALKSNSGTRQIVLQIWDGRHDFPDLEGKPVSKDIPCNICSILKIRNQKLHWTQIIRSNDLLLGVPHNFIQFTALQEIIAGWLEVDLGPYVQLSDSLHVYKRDWNILSQNTNTIQNVNTDNLSLSFHESQECIKKLAAFMEKLLVVNIPETTIVNLVKSEEFPSAYQNMFYVVSAYAARKHEYNEAAEMIIEKCSNSLYKTLWRNWTTYRSQALS